MEDRFDIESFRKGYNCGKSVGFGISSIIISCLAITITILKSLGVF